KLDRISRLLVLHLMYRRAIRHNPVHPATNEIACQVRQSIVTTFRPAVLDCDVASLDMAGFAQALAERAQDGARIPSGRLAVQKPDYWHGWLLRVRRERPSGHRAAERG